ncbi:MAG: hypothetical protein ACR2GH_13275 [Pseudonocardia sp.]
MTPTHPTTPVCVLLTERGYGDLGIGHSHGSFWCIPRDRTGRLRRALTDALVGCGLDSSAGNPGHWGDSPDLPMLPASIAVWRRADDTLTLNLVADVHHRVPAEHAAALRHAILAALHDRATDPGRHPEPPWPTTGPPPSITAPTTGSPPAEADHRPRR